MHIWIVIYLLSIKSQASHKSSKILYLLLPAHDITDFCNVPKDKSLKWYKSGECVGYSSQQLHPIHCSQNNVQEYTKCNYKMWQNTIMHKPYMNSCQQIYMLQQLLEECFAGTSSTES